MNENVRKELPIVQGRMHNGEVRVDESDLESGGYRVEFGGEIIGEVRVIDPIVGMKSNRTDRRRDVGVNKYKLPPHPLGGLSRRSR